MGMARRLLLAALGATVALLAIGRGHTFAAPYFVPLYAGFLIFLHVNAPRLPRLEWARATGIGLALFAILLFWALEPTALLARLAAATSAGLVWLVGCTGLALREERV